MSYRIEITPAARREVRALPAYVRSQAVQLIDELGRNPKPARVWSSSPLGMPGFRYPSAKGWKDKRSHINLPRGKVLTGGLFVLRSKKLCSVMSGCFSSQFVR